MIEHTSSGVCRLYRVELDQMLSIPILLCQILFPVYYTDEPVYPPPGYHSLPPPHGWTPPHQGEGTLPRVTCELWTRLVLSPHAVLSADNILWELVYWVMEGFSASH